MDLCMKGTAMTDMQQLFRVIDELSSQERDQLKEYFEAYDKAAWWVVPPENIAKIADIMRPVQEDAATMTEAEMNTLIDEVIAEVRDERQQRQSRH